MLLLPVLDEKDMKLLELVERVDVVIKEDIGSSDLLEWKLIKGNRVKIPLWLLEILERRNLVEVQERMDLRYLDSLVLEEKSSLRPVQISEQLFRWARETINELKNYPERATELERAKVDLDDILRARLGKLVKYASFQGPEIALEKFSDRLNPEEALLFRSILSLIKHYSGILRGVSGDNRRAKDSG
ncbi:MAG: hypothetical protein ACP5KE_06745 [Candidatus Methanodesulfokora sp.]|nr:MAG: hypothetical protein C0200_03270 [Candidatus Korarchaeota archaeon]